MVRAQKTLFLAIFAILWVQLRPSIATAQTSSMSMSSTETSPSMSMSSSQTSAPGGYWGTARIYNGVGMTLVGTGGGALVAYLLTQSVPGGDVASVAVGAISLVAIVSGIVEIVNGSNQLREHARTQRVQISPLGMRMTF